MEPLRAGETGSVGAEWADNHGCWTDAQRVKSVKSMIKILS